MTTQGMDDSPIVVFGAPRSGTSYLTDILNQHPAVHITNETRIFLWMHRAMTELTAERANLFQAKEAFCQHLERALPTMVRDFYTTLAPNARHWGDKNPHYAEPWHVAAMETVDRVFPSPRFLHIVRDGRDVVTSLVRLGWRNFDNAHADWLRDVVTGREFRDKVGADRCFELRYEDLVADDRGVATEIFAFLGIPMHESVLAFCDRQLRARTLSVVSTRNLDEGVQKSAWGEWFPPDLRSTSLERLAEKLVAFGYETVESIASQRSTSARESPRQYGPVRAVVQELVPSGAAVLIVSDGRDHLLDLPSIRSWHFPQMGLGRASLVDDTMSNIHAGRAPRDDEEALHHLAMMCRLGATHLLVPDFSLWWLHRYSALFEHLESQYTQLWRGDQGVLYALQG